MWVAWKTDAVQPVTLVASLSDAEGRIAVPGM
jgi:hypothetical protein